MKNLGQWLLSDRRYAASGATVFSILPYFGVPVGFIASIIVGFIALRKGWQDALFVMFWASGPAVALLLLGHSLVIVDALLFHIVCIVILALLLRQYQSWSLVLESCVPIGMLILAVLHLIVGATPEFWVTNLSNLTDQMAQSQGGAVNPEQVKNLVMNASIVANGIVAALVLFTNVINLLVARAWQALLFNPGGLMQEFCQIRIGWLVSVFTCVVLAAAFFKVQIAYEMLVVLAIPYFFAGLSLVHASVQQRKNKLPLLLFLYASLLLLSVYIAALLVVVGYFDSWYDIRRRHASFRIAKS